MTRPLIILFLSFLFFSCHKKMGGFQRSSRETFYSSSKDQLNIVESFPVYPENLEASASEEPDFKTISIPKKSNITDLANGKQKVETKLNNKKPEVLREKKDNADKIRKRIKRNPVFNDTLKMGFVFLLIAIGLSFLPVLELTLLFAIVAMVLLFIGFKKFFKRRIKEKNRKIRKENNEIRKQKVKDLFIK